MPPGDDGPPASGKSWDGPCPTQPRSRGGSSSGWASRGSPCRASPRRSSPRGGLAPASEQGSHLAGAALQDEPDHAAGARPEMGEAGRRPHWVRSPPPAARRRGPTSTPEPCRSCPCPNPSGTTVRSSWARRMGSWDGNTGEASPTVAGVRRDKSRDRLNRRLRGRCGSIQGGVRSVHARLDEWLRMRVRSLPRWRVGREGRGGGRDLQRHPNAYFAEWGLLSLHERATTERTRPATRV